MYEAFYGLNRKPFSLAPDPSFLYLSPHHEKVYTYLLYAVLEGKGLVVITGEVGSGKTTLLNYLLPQLEKQARVVLISNTALSPTQFLKLLCRELGAQVQGSDKVELLKILEGALSRSRNPRRRLIFVVDEAQNLSLQTLEEIRLILNLGGLEDNPPFQFILVGQPELRHKLQHPSLKQLLQRISVSCHLEPLSLEETKTYVRHRLEQAGARNPNLFTPEALEAIYEASKGIPRLINLLCDAALVYGFADGLSRIDRSVIEAVVEDRRRNGLLPNEGSPEKKRKAPEEDFSDLATKLEALENRLRVLEALVADLSQHLNTFHRIEKEWNKLSRFTQALITRTPKPPLDK